MKYVCAWCGKVLNSSDNAPSRPISHGMCRDCLNAMLPEEIEAEGQALRDLLDRIAAPVMMVDANSVVLGANREAAQALGHDASTMRGMRPGDAIHCVNANLPGGCGEQSVCIDCVLRNSVVHTHETGDAVVHAATPHSDGGVAAPNGVTRAISTEKLGRVVLVRVDETADV